MAALALQNFLSAATGLAIAVAVIRGIARAESKTIGDFWVDLTRSTLRVLLPISLVAAIVLMSQGVVRSFSASAKVATLDGATARRRRSRSARSPRRRRSRCSGRTAAVVGSSLIGQAVTSPELFRTRPSAAGNGYDATASGGSNLGPTSKALAERVAARVARARAENPEAKGPAPVDAVTASGSGLDPDISPAFALWQVPRVSRESGIPATDLEAMIARLTEGRFLGLFGELRVNVFLLNLDVLDRGTSSRPPSP